MGLYNLVKDLIFFYNNYLVMFLFNYNEIINCRLYNLNLIMYNFIEYDLMNKSKMVIIK